MARRAVVPALLSLALLAACTPAPPSTGDAPGATPESTGAGDASASPADAFLAALASHCGQAFAGRVVADQPAPPAGQPDPFAGKALVMHVRGCDQPRQGLRIPFHVGEDRSRTWLLTRTPGGLRLEHDHRHEDGSPDAVTMYGGDSRAPGTAARQEFPVGASSVAMFQAAGLQASLRNTWAMEIEPGRRFRYELSRPDGRLFQVDFDLSTPVEPPPAPWGAGTP